MIFKLLIKSKLIHSRLSCSFCTKNIFDDDFGSFTKLLNKMSVEEIENLKNSMYFMLKK